MKERALNLADRLMISIGIPILVWALFGLKVTEKENLSEVIFFGVIFAAVLAMILTASSLILSSISITQKFLNVRIFLKEKRIEWACIIEIKYPIQLIHGPSTPFAKIKTREGEEFTIPMGGKKTQQAILDTYLKSKSIAPRHEPVVIANA